MIRNILMLALFGVCYGSIFEHSLKFSSLKKGINRFEMGSANEKDKSKLVSSKFQSVIDKIGNNGDLAAKLRAALLLRGQPAMGNSLLSMFPGVKLSSQGSGETSGVRLQSYSIANCSDTQSGVFVVRSLTVGPDPLSMPGSLDIDFNINIMDEISNLSIALDFEKKVGSVYIKIPCIGQFGSCTYPVCDMLQQVTSCPQQLVQNNIPCQCPFKQGVYKLSQATFDVQGAVFPPGDYKVTANMTSYVKGAANFAGCYNIKFTLA